MKKLFLILTAAAGAALLLAGISPADGIQYRTRSHGYEPTHAERHDNFRRRNVVEIVSVAQVNPAYVSAYNQDAYDSVTQAAILAEIKSLSARLDQLNALYLSGQAGARAPGAPPTSPAPTAPGAPAAPSAPVVIPPTTPGGSPGLLIPPAAAVDLTTPAAGLATLVQNCAACHTQGKLNADTKFNLLTAANGKPQQLVSLTAQQKLAVVTRVYTGSMPKQPNSFGIKPFTGPEGDAKVAGIIRLMSQ